MKKQFDADNPFVQFLSRAGDLMVLNVLFLLCSVPIVTAGASLTAMLHILQGYPEGREPKIIPTFFRTFRANFRQATVAWILVVVLLLVLGYDFLFFDANFSGGIAIAAKFLSGALMVVVIATAGYLFPLMARYENTLKQLLGNALILAVSKLPRTLCMTALHLFPLAVAFLSPSVFLYSIIFWLLIGFALVCWLDCLLLAPVLRQLEKENSAC